MITFGQYNTLAATRQRSTLDQVTLHTKFNALMVQYYIAGLLAGGLITAVGSGSITRYELTEAGMACLKDYERHNPELNVSRALKTNAPN